MLIPSASCAVISCSPLVCQALYRNPAATRYAAKRNSSFEKVFQFMDKGPCYSGSRRTSFGFLSSLNATPAVTQMAVFRPFYEFKLSDKERLQLERLLVPYARHHLRSLQMVGTPTSPGLIRCYL